MEWPLYEGDLRLVDPNIPEDVTGEFFPCPDGYVLVHQDPMPQYDMDLSKVSVLPPVLENNTWVSKWSDPIYFTEEQLAQREQMKKNDLRDYHIKDLTIKGSAPDVIG